MDQLTPHEAEILRLWGVIRKLENRAHMTEQEETLFGEVYQQFKRTDSGVARVVRGSSPQETAAMRVAYIRRAAFAMRALFDFLER